ncbi:MAG TPA: hypothetical protein PKD23_03265 [Bellilinea sp.]|jgi:hypothetical protein|nr:hypothetical protein [Bellilinea sp.]
MGMFSNFDEKGKIFTQVVTKEPVNVIIQTNTHRIQGKLHIRPEDRLKDELDNCSHFLAVTNASVFNLDGSGSPVRTAFMAVNIDAVVWVIPDNDTGSDEESPA